MLEALQSEVKELQRENQRLRLVVQANIPDNALQIIAECCTTNPLFDEDEGDGKLQDPAYVGADFSLMQSLTLGQQCFVLSDPKLPDNPIVFASPGFYRLTGYTQKEVLGRNCRFLQGPGTNPQAVEVIRKAIATGTDATVCLLNYKADGTAFWNQFFIAALRDSDNNIVNYVRGSVDFRRNYTYSPSPSSLTTSLSSRFRTFCLLRSESK
jgi:PAS domain S-box-containing protein